MSVEEPPAAPAAVPNAPPPLRRENGNLQNSNLLLNVEHDFVPQVELASAGALVGGLKFHSHILDSNSRYLERDISSGSVLLVRGLTMGGVDDHYWAALTLKLLGIKKTLRATAEWIFSISLAPGLPNAATSTVHIAFTCRGSGLETFLAHDYPAPGQSLTLREALQARPEQELCLSGFYLCSQPRGFGVQSYTRVRLYAGLTCQEPGVQAPLLVAFGPTMDPLQFAPTTAFSLQFSPTRGERKAVLVIPVDSEHFPSPFLRTDETPTRPSIAWRQASALVWESLQCYCSGTVRLGDVPLAQNLKVVADNVRGSPSLEYTQNLALECSTLRVLLHHSQALESLKVTLTCWNPLEFPMASAHAQAGERLLHMREEVALPNLRFANEPGSFEARRVKLLIDNVVGFTVRLPRIKLVASGNIRAPDGAPRGTQSASRLTDAELDSARAITDAADEAHLELRPLAEHRRARELLKAFSAQPSLALLELVEADPLHLPQRDSTRMFAQQPRSPIVLADEVHLQSWSSALLSFVGTQNQRSRLELALNGHVPRTLECGPFQSVKFGCSLANEPWIRLWGASSPLPLELNTVTSLEAPHARTFLAEQCDGLRELVVKAPILEDASFANVSMYRVLLLTNTPLQELRVNEAHNLSRLGLTGSPAYCNVQDASRLNLECDFEASDGAVQQVGAAPRLFPSKNECPICYTTLFCFQEPCADKIESFALPCGHILCLSCAQEIIDPDGSCICPVCRKGFEQVEGLSVALAEPMETDSLEPEFGRAPGRALWEPLLGGTRFGNQDLHPGTRAVSASAENAGLASALAAREVTRTDFSDADRVGTLLCRLLGLRASATGRLDNTLEAVDHDVLSEEWVLDRHGTQKHARLVSFRFQADLRDLAHAGRPASEALADLLREASAQVPDAREAALYLTGFFVCWGHTEAPNRASRSPLRSGSRPWYSMRPGEDPYVLVELYLGLELRPRARDYECLQVRDPYGYYGDGGGAYGAQPARLDAVVLLPSWRPPSRRDLERANYPLSRNSPAATPNSDREGFHFFSDGVVILHNLPRAKDISVSCVELAGQMSLAGVNMLFLSFGLCSAEFYHAHHLRSLNVVQYRNLHAHSRRAHGDDNGVRAPAFSGGAYEGHFPAVKLVFQPPLRAERLAARVNPPSGSSGSSVLVGATLSTHPHPLQGPGAPAGRSAVLPRAREREELPGPHGPRPRAQYEHAVLHALLRAFESAKRLELVEGALSGDADAPNFARRAAGADDDLTGILPVNELELRIHSAALGALFRGSGEDAVVRLTLQSLQHPVTYLHATDFKQAFLNLAAAPAPPPQIEAEVVLRGRELVSLEVTGGRGVHSLWVTDAALLRLEMRNAFVRRVHMPLAQLQALVVEQAPALEVVTQPGPSSEWVLKGLRVNGAPLFQGLVANETLQRAPPP
jgi:hypothetical protein